VTEVNVDTQLAADLITALSGIRRALRRRVGPAAGAASLTEAQRELVRVVRMKPRIRVGEAAAELQLAPNTVSTLVSQLSAAGWLRRETDPQDARSAFLLLTPAAETRVAEWRDRRLAALQQALAQLSAADRSALERAIPALSRVVDRLREPP
jgi:DNA-binding MarR family transcriptional regulator